MIEEMVRRDLVGEIASGQVSAVGLWEGDELCGVAAWRIYDADPLILCRGILIAVANSHRRKGYGRQLKEAMKDAARAAGAAAISSLVDQRNRAMIELNKAAGAVVERIVDDPDYVRCIVPLR